MLVGNISYTYNLIAYASEVFSNYTHAIFMIIKQL